LIAEWIARAARRQGGAVPRSTVLEDGAGTGTLTYAGLWHSTRAWAAPGAAGARVTVRLPDPLSYAAAVVSILGAGRVVISLDPGAPAAELSRVLAAARPEAAVSDSAVGLPQDRSFGPNGPGSSPATERAVIPAGASGLHRHRDLRDDGGG
jgi:acyl-CoA synthetase (AMP-forming)/AMP-acid ligase II